MLLLDRSSSRKRCNYYAYGAARRGAPLRAIKAPPRTRSTTARGIGGIGGILWEF